MEPNPQPGPSLTDEQRRPLSVRGASVALSAGAGCGKTTVLTERFLAALDDGMVRRPLRALLAMTFTEKAARELRQRIRAECHRRLAGAEGEDVAFWRSVLRGLEAAPVSTFHEYCSGLIRRHAVTLGIDPEFEILEPPIAATVRDEAISRCIRRWLADRNADLIALAVELGLERTREALDRLVDRHDLVAMSLWVDRTEPELLTIWRDAWESDGKPALAVPLLRAARACADWLAANPLDHPKLIPFRANLLEALAQIEEPLEPAFLDELKALTTFPGGVRVAHWPSTEANEGAKKVIKPLRDQIKKYLDRSSIDEETSLLAAANGLRFIRLAVEAKKAYDEAKRDRGGLDFDDLLFKARDLFRQGPDAVRGEPGRAVEFVLVDEFQDTDPVQSEILQALGGEAVASGGLFVVGDFKQSIYRFRGAMPQLFRDYRDAFPAEGRHDLTVNFRSGPGIIDFVNALFADAFTGERPRLLPGPHSRAAEDRPAIEFVWAAENDPEADKPNASARRRVEARWLARLIDSRLEQGWMILDPRTKQPRRAHAGDVAFLFRAMTDLAPYESALEAEGLDYHVVGGTQFYTQQEVQDLVNVLSVIEDPHDAIALAGALRGPFFGLSDEALFWLGGTGDGGLTEDLDRLQSIEGASSLDRRRAERANALLARWRGLKDRVPIADLVDRVLDESGFEASLLGERLGDRKRANARKLVRLARDYDARGGFTLAQFVARLRAYLREPPREEQAATTEEEGTSVRLMTIHQAKGLEFPIVVVPDLNRKQDLRHEAVALHPDLGPLVRPVAPGPSEGSAADDAEVSSDDESSGRSLGWTTYDALERVEEDAEATRLFYVATTRARDALILSAGVSPDARAEAPALRLLAERFDLVTGACVAALPEGWTAPVVRVTRECPPSSVRPRGRKRPPRLRAVARVIESAIENDRARDGSTDRPRPRFVELEALHDRPPRSERLDRLVRSILVDARALQPGALGRVAHRAARRQAPMASEELTTEAIALLEAALAGRMGAILKRAAGVERGVEWTVTWPPLGASVFQGRAEFYTRDDSGAWSVVIVTSPGAVEGVERLRLLLAARAADALGFGSVRSGWLVRLGARAESVNEKDFDDDAIEEAVRRVLV